MREKWFIVSGDSLSLYPYQAEGAAWLAQGPNIKYLADDCGLGKSPQAITARDQLGPRRTLVVCPGGLRTNWWRELATWGLSPHTIQHQMLVKLTDTPLRSSTTVVCSYNYATKCIDKLVAYAPEVVILDEVHQLKGVETQRSRAIWRSDLINADTKVWCLSATPMPNNASELWNFLYISGVTPLDFNAFVKRYCSCVFDGYGVQIKGSNKRTLPELKRLIDESGVMLRRKKIDVLKDLPPIGYQTVTVQGEDLSADDMECHRSLAQWVYPVDRRAELKAVEAAETEILNAELSKDAPNLEAVAGSVSTIRKLAGLRKLKPVARLIADELEAGAYEKIIVAAYHRDVILALHAELSKFGAAVLFGGVPDVKRQAIIDKFQEPLLGRKSDLRVIVIQLNAAGVGLNLTAATRVARVERSYSPSDNYQVACRAHRIGQLLPVTVVDYELEGSCDQSVSSILARKEKEISFLFS